MAEIRAVCSFLSIFDKMLEIMMVRFRLEQSWRNIVPKNLKKDEK